MAQGADAMQWTELKTNWKDLQTKVQSKWTKLTQDDLKAIAGNREELIKRLQSHYKTEKVKLSQEVDDFVKNFKPAKI
jgi:uncharacterized protein YjbJ (UPF0337 family)